MIGHAATLLGTTAMDLLHTARIVVDVLPDTIDGELVRCHEVARVVAEVLLRSGRFDDLVVVDGKFGVHDHSWIRGRVATSVSVILDPYAVGRIPMVQVLDVNATLLPYRRESGCDRCGSPNQWLYREGPARDDVRHEVVAALHSYLTWFEPKRGDV